MIQITDAATKQLNSLKAAENKPEAVLRVVVKQGGCSGYSYKMDFTEETSESDKVFESNGSKVAVDSQSLLYLLGMTLDFEGGLNGQGFIFKNPNATKTCGCGSSFAV